MPSFFHTRTTALAHGLLDGSIAPILSISSICAFTFSYIPQRNALSSILWMVLSLSIWLIVWLLMFYPSLSHFVKKCNYTHIFGCTSFQLSSWIPSLLSPDKLTFWSISSGSTLICFDLEFDKSTWAALHCIFLSSSSFGMFYFNYIQVPVLAWNFVGSWNLTHLSVRFQGNLPSQ